MAVLDIKIYGNPVLREKCRQVEAVTPELVALAHDMLDTMYDAGGVGLAAPQVGKDVRLVVIDPARPDENETPAPRIIFNPSWGTEADSENVPYDEGCLSVPDVFCNVYRPGKIWIRYTDENGQTVEEHNVEGLLCRCFQHETDHLDGKLFVDVISTADRELNRSRLRDMVKKEKKKLESKKTGKR